MARRILLLITDLEIGGTPTVVRELAVRLHRLPGVEVQVACLARWGPVAEELASAGVRVTALNASGAHDLRIVRRLVDLIRRERFDTVLSFLIHANATAAATSIVCRDVRFLQSIQTTQPQPRWHWWLQSIVQHAAEKIVVPSVSVAQVAQGWTGVPADKLVVIPNAIDPDEFPASPNPAANPDPYPIGFIGRLDPIKRIPDLLVAVQQLRDRVHLRIFGEGSQRPLIESEVARLRIGQQVTLHGAVAHPQDALQQIGLLVLPSAAEGFGLVLIEAMAARVPVVATDVPGIRNVVQHERTGLLVRPGSPDALACAIARVVDDADLRRRLIDQAHEYVRGHFTWTQVLPQYRSLLGLGI